MIKVIIIYNGKEVYRDYLGSLIRYVARLDNSSELFPILEQAINMIYRGFYTLEFNYSSKDTTKASIALMVTITD